MYYISNILFYIVLLEAICGDHIHIRYRRRCQFDSEVCFEFAHRSSTYTRILALNWAH